MMLKKNKEKKKKEKNSLSRTIPFSVLLNMVSMMNFSYKDLQLYINRFVDHYTQMI